MSSDELTDRFLTLDDAARYVSVCAIRDGPSMMLGADQWEGDSQCGCSFSQCMDQVKLVRAETTSAEVMSRCSVEQQSVVPAQSASVTVPVPVDDVSSDDSLTFDAGSPLNNPSLHTSSGIGDDVSPAGNERVRVKKK